MQKSVDSYCQEAQTLHKGVNGFVSKEARDPDGGSNDATQIAELVCEPNVM
jgi:hypothetical protein